MIDSAYSKKLLIIYSCFLLITILLGLMSRSSLIQLPEFITLYAGDTLWGLMVFWLACIALPSKRIRLKAFAAIVFAFSIEFSQLYQAEWINAIRSYKLGALVLGYGFKPSDLLCYTVGIAFGALVDVKLIQSVKTGHS